MRYIILFIFLNCFIKSNLTAQNYMFDPTTQQISDYHAVYRFNNFGVYDLDLKRFTKSFNLNSEVVIDVNEDGTGRFILVIGNSDKKIFTILSVYKKVNSNNDKYIECTIVNPNGRQISALIWYSNYVEVITINNPDNNSDIYLSNK